MHTHSCDLWYLELAHFEGWGFHGTEKRRSSRDTLSSVERLRDVVTEDLRKVVTDGWNAAGASDGLRMCVCVCVCVYEQRERENLLYYT
jgi:hypothetical protein